MYPYNFKKLLNSYTSTYYIIYKIETSMTKSYIEHGKYDNNFVIYRLYSWYIHEIRF